MPRNPKIAGEIISARGERIGIVGETLADVFDLDTWEVVVDTRATYTPEEDTERHARLEVWERHMKANPPESIA